MSAIYKPCMFVKGGQISERGAKFPRKYGPREGGGQIFFGGRGEISCDTGGTRVKADNLLQYCSEQDKTMLCCPHFL